VTGPATPSAVTPSAPCTRAIREARAAAQHVVDACTRQRAEIPVDGEPACRGLHGCHVAGVQYAFETAADLERLRAGDAVRLVDDTEPSRVTVRPLTLTQPRSRHCAVPALRRLPRSDMPLTLSTTTLILCGPLFVMHARGRPLYADGTCSDTVTACIPSQIVPVDETPDRGLDASAAGAAVGVLVVAADAAGAAMLAPAAATASATAPVAAPRTPARARRRSIN
jgi:hypothetical protein